MPLFNSLNLSEEDPTEAKLGERSAFVYRALKRDSVPLTKLVPLSFEERGSP